MALLGRGTGCPRVRELRRRVSHGVVGHGSGELGLLTRVDGHCHCGEGEGSIEVVEGGGGSTKRRSAAREVVIVINTGVRFRKRGETIDLGDGRDQRA